MNIEVAFALPGRQWVLKLDLPSGSTVQKALDVARLTGELPDIDLSRASVGIFGRAVSLTRPLEDGDRVEIYRSLTNDPKQMRRVRAAKQMR